ncbi:MAG: hypothetical protein ACE364_05545 [Chlorobiota bacterium]
MRIYIFTTIILLISAFSVQSSTQWEMIDNKETVDAPNGKEFSISNF